jgi:hypothetical protein
MNEDQLANDDQDSDVHVVSALKKECCETNFGSSSRGSVFVE